MANEKIEVQVVVDESEAVKGIASLDRSLDNMAVSLAMLEGSVDRMNGKLDSLGTLHRAARRVRYKDCRAILVRC